MYIPEIYTKTIFTVTLETFVNYIFGSSGSKSVAVLMILYKVLLACVWAKTVPVKL